MRKREYDWTEVRSPTIVIDDLTDAERECVEREIERQRAMIEHGLTTGLFDAYR